MKRKQLTTMTGASIGIILLIFDSPTALQGAKDGIELCLRTVIPSLFPFFVLSMLLTSSLLGISVPLLKPLLKLLRIPDGTESLLLTGFLGGYPVGAQCVVNAYQGGQLTQRDAERMLPLCNNAGPSFLFGMVGCVLQERWMVWPLWAVLIISSLLSAIIFPGSKSTSLVTKQAAPISAASALTASLRVMAGVCGWVVVFRVVIAFLGRWLLWLFPVWAQVMITGLLELANGCCSLSAILNPELRFILAAMMLSFGGVCVTMQTASVAGDLSLKPYFLGKVLQAMFSLVLSFIICGYPRGLSTGLITAVSGCLVTAIVIITVRNHKKVIAIRQDL